MKATVVATAVGTAVAEARRQCGGGGQLGGVGSGGSAAAVQAVAARRWQCGGGSGSQLGGLIGAFKV